MTRNTIKDLEEISNTVRASIVSTSHKRKIPHLGSCLSCLDILVNLYWREMRLSPDEHQDPDRDRFFLSKGHAAPALLHVLAYRGFYELERLEEFGHDGSYFHEHPPVPGLIPGIEAATGSLGHGLPIATGVALANKIKRKVSKTYAVVGDGECNEGVIWESAMFAAAAKLSKLTVFIDFNRWQATGRSTDTLGPQPLADKWRSFGWNVEVIDGHCHHEISAALDAPSINREYPKAIVANTIKGKGISFMEDDNNWHYKTPNAEEFSKAMNELRGSLR